MLDDEPKQRSCMPAFICLFMLCLFAFACVAPMVIPGVKAMDPGMQQTLIVLVVGSVGYYISTTQQSAKKDETIASINKGTP